MKSRDGKVEGELVGVAAPTSKFPKLQIGMELNEVTKLIGGGNQLIRITADPSGARCQE